MFYCFLLLFFFYPGLIQACPGDFGQQICFGREKTQSAINLLQDDVLVADPGTK